MQNSYLWSAYSNIPKTRIALPHGIFVAVNYTGTEFVDDPIHIFPPKAHYDNENPKWLEITIKINLQMNKKVAYLVSWWWRTRKTCSLRDGS